MPPSAGKTDMSTRAAPQTLSCRSTNGLRFQGCTQAGLTNVDGLQRRSLQMHRSEGTALTLNRAVARVQEEECCQQQSYGADRHRLNCARSAQAGSPLSAYAKKCKCSPVLMGNIEGSSGSGGGSCGLSCSSAETSSGCSREVGLPCAPRQDSFDRRDGASSNSQKTDQRH